MLFSKPRPRGVGADSTVAELFAAVGSVASDEGVHARNLKAIRDHLTRTRGLPLVAADLDGIEHAYRAFYSRGFAIRYQPTYDDLMIQTDGEGVSRSYLASEASFAFLKDLESRNLVVPIVGDFGGPKAIRSIGAYLKAHDATVAAFYLSNVGQLSLSGWEVDGVLPERGGAAARQLEHLHSLIVGPRAGLSSGIRVEPRVDDGGGKRLWGLAARAQGFAPDV